MAIHTLNKVTYKTSIPTNQWTEGQLAWLEGKNLPLPYGTAKLAPRRHGPFKITKIISPVAVQLELPAQWNIHPVFHTSLLMPYTETPSHGPNFTRPPPDLIDGEEEYEVEQIRSHRTWGWHKTLQYLIKWKGYPESDNTWEDTDQIHAPILIKLYHQTLPSANLKAQQVRLEGNHPSILSLPKAFSCSLPSSTILQESTAALVWSKAHERDTRSACNPLHPLAQSLLARRTHATLLSSSVMSTGNPSILQMSTANNDSLPSGLPLHAPDSSTQCLPLHPTTPPSSHHTRIPSSSCLELTRLPPCPSHHAPFAPPSKPRQILITTCCAASPTGFSKPSPTKRRAPVWPPNTMKTTSTTWSRKYSTTNKPSTSHLRAMNSMMGRSVTSTSRSAEGYIKKPSGFGSTTTAPCPATTAPKDPTSGPISSIYTPPLTTVSIHHLNRSQRGSDICSPAQAETFKSSKKWWPIPGTGATPGRLPAIACSTTRSLPWQSRSRSTSATWTQPAPVSDHVSPDLCSCEPQRGSPPYKMCQGKLEHYARGGRRPLICCEAFTSIQHHWKMSKDVQGCPS
jgi:Chromo (CHRromatin Organisation MOdifier) domain